MNAHASEIGAFLLTQFFFRHWMIGIENGVVTLGLGLGIVALLRLSGLFKPAAVHGFRHLVAVVSLYKTALYFVLGTAARFKRPYHSGFGVQLPGPQNLLPFGRVGPYSIWHPTALSHVLPAALCCYALARLLLRVWQVTRARRAIAALTLDVSDAVAASIRQSVRAASEAIGKPRLGGTPVSVIGCGFGPTPFVLGVIRPCIVIDDEVLQRLSASGDSCLESAMRHELAHIARGDHLLRWAQAWLADIAGITLLGPYLSAQATRFEEQVCDSIALCRAGDAPFLSRAIVIATESCSAPPVVPTPPVETIRQARRAAPYFEAQLGLLGLLNHSQAERVALLARLRSISRQANAMRSPGDAAPRKPTLPLAAARFAFLLVRIAAAALLFLMLAVVFYVKVYCFRA